MLRKISRVLENHPDYHINVEGHTDNMPLNATLRERWGSNWQLSTARSVSVIDCFERLGLSAERLTAEGYGPYRPLMSNETSQGRRQNRRVELIVRLNSSS